MGFTIFNFRLYFQVFNQVNFFGFVYVILSFAVVVYLSVFLLGAIPDKEKKRPAQPLGLRIIRVVILVGFFFFVILEPVFIKVDKDKNFYKKPPVALALDFSKSMAVTKRTQDVFRWLDINEKLIRENFDLKIFAFGLAGQNYVKEFNDTQELKNYFGYGTASTLTAYKKSSRRTNIPFAISQILSKRQTVQVDNNNLDEGFAGGVAGILLVSDGVNTTKQQDSSAFLMGINSKQDDKNPSLYSAPVFPIDIFPDESRNPADISILSIDAPAYAFKGMDIPITLKVKKKRTTNLVEQFSVPLLKVMINIKGVFTTDKNPESTASSIIMKKENTDIMPQEEDITQKGYVFTFQKELSSGVNEIKLNIPSPGDRTGRILYTVEISTFSWEITNENNRKSFSVDILRDKIRILYLCGRPSYEYSFLRDFIKNDLGFELVTFVILRNVDDVVLVPDEELSLIPFPGADLIIKQLRDFNVVIFDNFTYQRFGIYPQHLDMLKKWVSDGGGFLMIAGENSFSAGGYARTGVAEMLPVIIEEGKANRVEGGVFRPLINQMQQEERKKGYYDGDEFIQGWFELFGHQQTILQGSGESSSLLNRAGEKNIFDAQRDGGSNLNQFLYKLPFLEGVQVLKPRDDSTVVLSHPWIKVDQSRTKTAPVLAFRDFGKGRTGALLTNTTWRWKMSNEAPAGFYESFWKAVINYLASSMDKEAGQIRVIGLKKMVSRDENFNFIVKKRYPSSRLTVILAKPDGSKIILEPINWGAVPKEKVTPDAMWRKNNDIGYVMFSFPSAGGESSASSFLKEDGRYLIEVADEVVDKKVKPRIQKETFEVRVVSGDTASSEGDELAEISYLDVDEGYLKLLSIQTGGVYFKGDISSGGGKDSGIWDEVKRRILSRERLPSGSDEGDIDSGIKNEGLLWRVIWRPSGDLKIMVSLFMSLIVLELIIRRRKYGLL